MTTRQVIGATVLAAVAFGTGTAVAASGTSTTGRYELNNSAATQITTIRVRHPHCLNAEDSAAQLRVVHLGYRPAQGSVTYRCVNP